MAAEEIMVSDSDYQRELEEKKIFWQQVMQDWQKSGKEPSMFCAEHELQAHQFYYWRKKFNLENFKAVDTKITNVNNNGSKFTALNITTKPAHVEEIKINSQSPADYFEVCLNKSWFKFHLNSDLNKIKQIIAKLG